MRGTCPALLHHHTRDVSGFFEQFGTVSKLRLSRNKKTGKSKHFAFLEFATPEIAGIVADAMNDYMLMGQKLQCRVRTLLSQATWKRHSGHLPTQVLLKSEVHEDLWKGANRRFRTIPWRKIEMKRHNAPRTPEQSAQRLERAVARDRKRMARIAAAGIQYEYDALEAPEGAPKRKKRTAPEEKRTVTEDKRPAGKKAASKAEVSKAAAKVVTKAAKAKGRAADLPRADAKRRKKSDT